MAGRATVAIQKAIIPRNTPTAIFNTSCLIPTSFPTPQIISHGPATSPPGQNTASLVAGHGVIEPYPVQNGSRDC